MGIAKIKISPSIMAADFCSLKSEIAAIDEDLICSWHVDVMDGLFVPNMAVGLQDVIALRKLTALPIDVHLMVKYCDPIISLFAPYANLILIHPESTGNLNKSIDLILQHQCQAGLVINPDCEFLEEISSEATAAILPKLATIMVMTVRPGWCGQKFMAERLGVLKQAAALKATHPSLEIIVDGGINSNTISSAIAAGADVAVAGAAVFNTQADRCYNDNIVLLKECISV